MEEMEGYEFSTCCGSGSYPAAEVYGCAGCKLGMWSVADDRGVHSGCACGGNVLIRIDGGEVTAIHQ